MLLFQDIGFWHDVVEEKMPSSRFLVQTEHYTFMELIENSVMPAFFADMLPAPSPPKDRVNIPINDPEVQATYYLACKKEHLKIFAGMFSL